MSGGKPWNLICKSITSSNRTIVDAEGRHIADIYSGFSNAQALVQAANLQDELLAALRGMVEQCEALNAQAAFGNDFEAAGAAIAKAVSA